MCFNIVFLMSLLLFVDIMFGRVPTDVSGFTGMVENLHFRMSLPCTRPDLSIPTGTPCWRFCCAMYTLQFSRLADVPYPPSYQRFLNLLDVFNFGEND